MKNISFSILLLMSLMACNQEHSHVNQQDLEELNKKVEELEVKLNATEAQLLNVRSELAKYKGDSIPTATADSSQQE